MHPPRSSTPVLLFSTDLDGTVVGNPYDAAAFSNNWSHLDSIGRPYLVYNTGRSISNAMRLIAAENLPRPDVVIGSLGTEIYDSRYESVSAAFQKEFSKTVIGPAAIRRIEIGANVEKRVVNPLHPEQLTWWCQAISTQTFATLQSELAGVHPGARLTYSTPYLSVLPAWSDKGRALEWLCRRKQVPLEQVLVAGDSINDLSMFQLAGTRRLVVENAQPDLLAALVGMGKYVSEYAMARGVIDGLRFFGVLPELQRRAINS